MKLGAKERRDAAIAAAARVPLEHVHTADGFHLKHAGGFWINGEDNHILRFLLMYKTFLLGRATYQFRQLRTCLRLIPANRSRLALDVGAHIGTWSRILCQEFAQVIGFEAFKVHVKCLSLNVPNKNFRVVSGILSDIDGTQQFLELWKKPGMSRVALPGETGVDTESRRLDTVLAGNETPVDFIKIDVEGQEIQVLRGGVETIKRWHPLIILEQKGLSKDYEPGAGRFAATDFVVSLGARKLAQVGDDVILGWR